MIAHSSHYADSTPQPTSALFEQMLPTIERYARNAFRRFRREQRDDLVAEVVANAFVAFRRLVERNKGDLAYPTVLARFAVKQVRSGRKVGTKLNILDVTSHYAQRQKGIRVQSLHDAWQHNGSWQDVLVDDDTATPADIAAARIDYANWLKTLSTRNRTVATILASGESTRTAAKKFSVSSGRISQLRRELEQSWLSFQGEAA